MIFPFDRFVEFKVPRKSNYRCLELSPDGTMIAAVTINSVQIWSAVADCELLSTIPQNRPTGYSKALLSRVFVVWKAESDQILVIRSEGVADYYKIHREKRLVDDTYDDPKLCSEYSKTCIEPICSISIDQYGFPISVCSYYQRIIMLTDTGNVEELNWGGDFVGYPLSKLIPETLLDPNIDLVNAHPVSLSASSDLSCLAIALDNSNCLLLHIPSTFRVPTHVTVLKPVLTDGVRQLLFAMGLPYLAVVSMRLSVEFFSIAKMEDGSFTWKAIHQIDIRQYPQLNPSPLFLYDSITTLAWCPGQPIVALGLKYQGVMVWTIEGSMLYSYNGCIPAVCNNPQTKEESPMSIIEETEIEIALEVSCCCFNMNGTCLLFNIPYDQIIHKDNHIFCRDSRFLCQRFCVFSDTIYASCRYSRLLTNRENPSYFGYTSNSVVHVASHLTAASTLLPSLYTFPPSLLTSNEAILGMAVSPSNLNVLLFTASSVFVFYSNRAKWVTAPSLFSVLAYHSL